MSSKPKRQSLSTIESSVTRLLVSTKHLLESLTQWAQHEVDDKFVSDAYVKLGNDFRASVRAFTNAGVDISDLGDVPQALRVILEAALSEPPSQERLDRFLPNIRNIIVTLLQNLKVKQSKAKALSQEKEKEREREREERERTKDRDREREREREKLKERERAKAAAAVAARDRELVDEERDWDRSQNQRHSSRTIPSIISTTATSPSVSTSRSSSIAKKTSVPTFMTSNVASPTSSSSPIHNNEALIQLQKGNSLQRRASKRFSAYQYAKLTNNQPTLSSISSASERGTNLEVPHDERDTTLESLENETNNRSAADQSLNKGFAVPTNNSHETKSSISVFLRIHNRTKKVTVELPITFNSLRLLFVEKFAYSPGSNAFPEIYIQDPHNHHVSYELEDHLLSVDVKDGSVLMLNEPDPHFEKLKSLESKFEQLSFKVVEVNNHTIEEVTKMVKGVELSPETITSIISQIPASAPSKSEGSSDTADSTKAYIKPSDLAELSSIQLELKSIRAAQSKSKSSLSATLQVALDSLSSLKTSAITTSKSSNRTYMDTCHAKLSEESDMLLTKVDDLQDIMEALRKDVAQRGVRVGESQLKSTTKEIRDAKSSLVSMKEYITSEKGNWKRIWERELDTVCEEQQFFNLQDDLTNDLEDDIKRIEETYALIEQCSLEQSKQTGSKRNKFMAQLHIPEPGESLHSMKDAVLNEVAALRPNHESRLEAIEKAERLRDREREMMKLTKFQAELEDFVDDAKLKRSVGIEEIERLRKQKDEENLKSSFGVF